MAQLGTAMGERIKGRTLVAGDEGDDADGVVINLRLIGE
jgi:hypothetical protein